MIAATMAAAEPLLAVERLSVRFPGAAGSAAVDDVSFTLEQGAILGVVGESGAGKSTLGLALSGLIDSDGAELSGSIRLADNELTCLTDAQLCHIRGREIGMIFQDPIGSLDPAMPVVDQVAETIHLHTRAGRREARRRARRQLADAGVGEETLAVAPYAHQLSGGLCQRVMIAAALAAQPSLLIADEPTSSLDVTLQAQILAMLRKEQRRRGLAVIFISHDLALVSKFADRMMVMRHGKVVEMGEAETVFSNPRHPYTRELVSAWSWESVQGEAVAPA
ncbi:MAG: ABC transporter ATP-binding protein [Actinomycetota bacterium]|jgi:ABC-type glutathione transport system ATPase component|nr:ABC transporter ATP-binding protein [Actinomycetota bacterium]